MFDVNRSRFPYALSTPLTTLLTLLAVVAFTLPAIGQEEGETAKKDEPKPVKFEVADGKIKFTASGSWKKVEPKSNMLDAEFKIPRTEGDSADGRMTFMGAGGSVEANIQRWEDQFQGDIKSDISEKTVNGHTFHLVDIKGDYMEGMGGPFGPKTKRENYRMLAVIIETEKYGLHFIKLTGPQATLKANKKKFDAMLKSFQVEE